MLRHIPNALTSSRGAITLAIASIFVWHALAQWGHLESPGAYFPFRSWILILVLFGLVTDFLDGFFAKTYNWKSDFGARLDPLMDKWFSNVCLAGVLVYYGIGWYLVWFLPLCLWIWYYSRTTTGMRKRREILEANEPAKLKTGYLFFSQVAFMTAIASGDALSGDSLWYLELLAFSLAAYGMVRASFLCWYALEEYREQIEDKAQKAAPPRIRHWNKVSRAQPAE